jgi:hypothetical protein
MSSLYRVKIYVKEVRGTALWAINWAAAHCGEILCTYHEEVIICIVYMH